MSNADRGADPEIHAPKITVLNGVSVVIAAILVAVSISVVVQLVQSSNRSESAHARYNECASAATELTIASDYLTTQCRMFVMTGERTYMDAYFEELYVAQRRDEAVATLGMEAQDASAAARLTAALLESNELAGVEMYAMRLTAEAIGTDPLPEQLAAIEVSSEDAALSGPEKRARAQAMVLGDAYRGMKDAILQDASGCAEELVRGLEQQVIENEREVSKLLNIQIAITILLLAMAVFAAVSNHLFVTRPLREQEKRLREGRSLDIIGSYEIRRMAIAYNQLFEATQEREALLEHEAETDPLTGVLNRGPFNEMIEAPAERTALIVADVDHFKQINDQYGHEAGDSVLKKVASAFVDNFRSTDRVCRIGGDEFAVIATQVDSRSKDVIARKLASISATLADTTDGLPEVTMSFGVAFSDLLAGEDTLYRAADHALYESKNAGRNAVTFQGGNSLSD